MKITLNKDEIIAAIELYTREKCIGDIGYRWEISEIDMTFEDDNVVATLSVNAVKPVNVAPSPCAPACPPQPKQW